MSISADQPDAMTGNQGSGDNGNHNGNGNGRRIYPTNSEQDRPLNLYDDPAKVFLGGPAYKIILFLATVQSSSVMVFLRHRIGKRVMRGWIFQFLFVLLMLVGTGSFHLLPLPWFDASGGDGLVVLFAVLMAIMAIYHYHVARELTEAGIPERLQLHTRARGDSHLMWVMRRFPDLYLPAIHFYTRRIRWVQVLPLDEPTLQRILEPLLLFALSILFTVTGSWLGWWLGLSTLSLVIVETDYQNNAMEALDDHYDKRLESRTMRIIQDSLSQNSRTPAKINGIATAGIARVSQTLQQLQQERLSRME